MLDTWFSSGLWPFSTLGWPDDTEDLRAFYPTSLLITAFDIIFFWVARMIMLSVKFMGDVPFRTVYIHSLVRDAEGQKMSKSKGNVIDPLEVMDQYGTDAVRFTLAIMAAPGTDISLSHEKMLSHRAFANKIWNASRFVLMNRENIFPSDFSDYSIETVQAELVRRREELSLVDRWILSRLNGVIKETNDSLESYRFHEASFQLYHFFWHELCDWYLELIKPKILDSARRSEHGLSFRVLLYVFDQALKLLHPFMPFITEELWQRLPHQGISLAVQSFPSPVVELSNLDAEKSMAILEDVIVKIRNVRAEKNVEPGKRIMVNLAATDPLALPVLKTGIPFIQNLARCAQVNLVDSVGKEDHSARRVASGVEVEIPLAGLIDMEVERAKLGMEISKTEKEIAQILQKLARPDFLANAPEHVVRLNRERLGEFNDKLGRLKENLSRL